MKMEGKYRFLMAKSSPDTGQIWLPLWMHLEDTAGIMRKLVTAWIPESIVNASGMDYDQFMAISVFLAAVHDIGKASSYFQSIITKSYPEKYEEITASGFAVNKEYREPGRTPHAYAGQWILQSDTNDFGIDEKIAMVVGAHHGKPDGSIVVMGEPDLIKVYPVNFFGSECDDAVKKIWKDSWHEIVSRALGLAGIQSVSELPDVTLEAQVLLSGLLIAADWIASNPTYFPLISVDDYGDVSLYPKRVRDGWRKSKFPDSWRSEVNYMDQNIFKDRFGFPPNEIQEAMFQIVNSCENPGLFVLEAQMGIGKTEAALSAAEVLASRKQEGGIFFGLPTQATSNGLFDRLYAWSSQVSEGMRNAICLAHGSAEFHEQYNRLLMESRACIANGEDSEDAVEVHPWFQGNKKALLSNFVIGTVDQFLMASLRKRHFMLRHIGLAGKVVVIDECHAYDLYMYEYLKRSLQWMAAYGVPVILLSATLPSGRRKELVECYAKAYSKYHLNKRKAEITQSREGWQKRKAYPLITWTDGECIGQEAIQCKTAEKRVRIKRTGSTQEMFSLLRDRLEEGGCACIIANTVKKAQELYAECSRQMEGYYVILYHAQYTMPDRMEKERLVLEKMGKTSGEIDRDRLILIGTQVLEQSLDYDADIMVTQLCPVDLLLQRIGRLHRHKRIRSGRLQRPECIILQEEDGLYDSGTKTIYGEYHLMRTDRVLTDIIRLPGEIPDLVQKVYDEDDDLGLDGKRYTDAIAAYEKEMQRKQQCAGNYLMIEPKPKKGIDELLVNPEKSDEKLSEACVRDSESSIEVLLMKKSHDGRILFVDEDPLTAQGILAADVPDFEQAHRIARQRLKLPHIFSTRYNIDDTIRELEDINAGELRQWQQSPWIRGELVLLLDENNQAELNGHRLSYSYDKGLEYERKEENNAGEGV